MQKSVEWADGRLKLLDQTKLPVRVEFLEYNDYKGVAEAITSMVVRGAPAIGATAAYAYVLGAREFTGENKDEFFSHMETVANALGATRPTAVNLFWALRRMEDKLRELKDAALPDIKAGLLQEAQAIAAEDVAINRKIGEFGNEIIPDGAKILTHCNAGALATVGYGTALGVIRSAHEAGKKVKVYADETRPLLQGARLTAWELLQDNIPVTLITDNTAGYLMQKGLIDVAIVGADRIAANGDTANKIGTYSVAVLAAAHGIPFYVAAPTSTLDIKLSDGDQIPIEERNALEVRELFGQQVAPEEVEVFNPAFDVTPAKYITGIITEKGIISPPYSTNLLKVMVR
ncbi:MAG TPA: S-methyl-5-thioribose-1-phosphate isomerase [Desulfobacteria bacterium]|nr:S-methyl-5-thioribose-1-phosphate isomerase [Desulfobacteria bacterium]